MPNLEEHCKHNKKLYNYEFRELTKWMDRPVSFLGPSHQIVRHGKGNIDELINKAEKMFWDKTPEQYRQFIGDAVIEHLSLDAKPKARNKNKKNKKQPIVMPIELKPKFRKLPLYVKKEENTFQLYGISYIPKQRNKMIAVFGKKCIKIK